MCWPDAHRYQPIIRLSTKSSFVLNSTEHLYHCSAVIVRERCKCHLIQDRSDKFHYQQVIKDSLNPCPGYLYVDNGGWCLSRSCHVYSVKTLTITNRTSSVWTPKDWSAGESGRGQWNGHGWTQWRHKVAPAELMNKDREYWMS